MGECKRKPVLQLPVQRATARLGSKDRMEHEYKNQLRDSRSSKLQKHCSDNHKSTMFMQAMHLT